MLKEFLNELEKRLPLETLLPRYSGLFVKDSSNRSRLSNEAFSELTRFLETGEASYQAVAVQLGVNWTDSAQRVTLRNTLLRRGFLTPSCLWAYRELRGNADVLFREYPSAEMSLMQVLLLKEADPVQAVPYLIEYFLTRRDIPEELRSVSRLCVLRLLDTGISPEVVRSLQSRYPGVEILNQWRPGIPGRHVEFDRSATPGSVDFHQLVRSIHDMREFSSLTRTVYLLTLFYVPLLEKQWRSLLLSRTDELFFRRLRLAGMIEAVNGGFLLAAEQTKQTLVKTFLYDSYSLAKESVSRHRQERMKEERERKVKSSELDRQALEMVPDGIICVDRTGLLYYMNPAAETILQENTWLRERLFGTDSVDEALRRYSRESVLSRTTTSMRDDAASTEIFGDRITITGDGKKFEVELGPHVILIRDATDRYLIDQEIGKLYRHELKAALDVMGVGIETVRELLKEPKVEEALGFLDQVEKKRHELFTMLEERIDFIRLHSDAFHIRPSLVNLNLVVDKCVTNYRDTALSKKVVINSNHLHTQGVMVRGEERFLIRALENLIRNAVKFSRESSAIKVVLGSDNMEAYVRVEDFGPGIPQEHLGSIFRLGFTTGGEGRGLYLAKRIASAHGGRIAVKSSPGNGATFTFRMPMAVEA